MVGKVDWESERERGRGWESVYMAVRGRSFRLKAYRTV